MRKYAILMVLTVFVVAFASGCGLIVKDADIDAQTVIIEVAGRTFLKAEVQQAIENILDYQEYIYSLYGMSYDRTDTDTLSSAREDAINALIEEAVTEQKKHEYGLDQFSDEETIAINETIEETYAGYISTVKTYYFADTDLTGEELSAAVEAKMVELGYGSKEALLEQEKLNASAGKLRDLVVKDVAVTDDEIETEYNTNVANAITTYTSNPTQYASDVKNNAILYFTPPGYRYVKNLLIKISDENKALIQSLGMQIEDKQSSLDASLAAINELQEDPAEDTEDQAKSRAELTALSDTLSVDIEDLSTELYAIIESAYDAIQPTVDEVLARLDAGDDFDAILEEFGDDPGMTAEPQKTMGYLLCDGLTTYIDVFVNTSMALENIGDISTPFRSDSGVHIVKYASVLEDGQVPLSEIRSQIKSELLANKQDIMYDETVNQWIAEVNAKFYPERLAD